MRPIHHMQHALIMTIVVILLTCYLDRSSALVSPPCYNYNSQTQTQQYKEGRIITGSRSSSSSTTVLYSKKKDWTTSLFPVRPSAESILVASQKEEQPSLSQKQQRQVVQFIAAPPDTSFGSQACCQFYAGSIGALTGFGIASFKLSIETLRELTYSSDILLPNEQLLWIIPTLGGAGVALLRTVGGSFPPGVQGIVNQADQDSLGVNTIPIGQELVDSLRKSAAAICTLGTGCSLGPEGPGVEIGIAASRIGALFWPSQVFDTENEDEADIIRKTKVLRRNRLFLACGAAAGVSSGFNAPLSGVFFALEVIQRNLPSIELPPPSPPVSYEDTEATTTNGIGKKNDDNTPQTTIYEFQQQSLVSEAGSITAILTSSVVSALVIRIVLGNELALRILEYEIPTPLRELPLYLALGAISGLAAVLFSQTTQFAKGIVDGEIGPESVRDTFEKMPDSIKPVLGGLFCGVLGLLYPNILFFGYETLNGLLQNYQIETTVALSLLMAKIAATAISAATGLVGGTLAPSLFMGGMIGASFHNLVVVSEVDLLAPIMDFTTPIFGSSFEIATVPAYTMVGAASFLAAVFRAPLTASLLAFELTKNYDVLVPLLASAGVGTLFCDLVESRLDKWKQQQ